MKKNILFLISTYLIFSYSHAQTTRRALTYNWDKVTHDWILYSKQQKVTSDDQKTIQYLDTFFYANQTNVSSQEIHYKSILPELKLDSMRIKSKSSNGGFTIWSLYATYANDTLREQTIYFQADENVEKTKVNLDVYTYSPGVILNKYYQVSNGQLKKQDSIITKMDDQNNVLESCIYLWNDTLQIWRIRESQKNIFQGNMRKETVTLTYNSEGFINYLYSDSISITYNEKGQEIESKRFKKASVKSNWDLTEINTTTNAENGPVLVLTETWNGSEFINKQKAIFTYDALTSINAEITSPAISFYPNPVNDVLHLEMVNADNSFLNLKISNLQGEQIYEIQGGIARKIELPVDHLPKGIYILDVRDKTRNQKLKFIKY